MIEPEHSASDTEFAAVAAFWELSEESFPAAVVPPPLVPMVLHAVAEDPTANMRAVRHPVARARLFVPLLPGVTLRMQRSAAGAICACSQDYYADVDGCDHFVEEATRCGLFPRAAASLSLPGHRAPDVVSPVLEILARRSVVNRTTADDAIRGGVFEAIVALLRERAADSDSASDAMAVVINAALDRSLRAHLRSLGALGAIARLPPLGSLHLAALYQLTAAPPGLPDDDVPEVVVTSLGETLLVRSRTERAAEVLCHLIGPCGPVHRVHALMRVPGLVEHLYGGEVVAATAVRRLASSCCLAVDEVCQRAVAAGFLRLPALYPFLSFDSADPDQAVTALQAVQKTVCIVPAAASDAVRSRLPSLLAAALRSWLWDPAVPIAAACCLAAVVEACEASDVPQFASNDVLAAATDALRNADNEAVHAAVVAALGAIAARDATAFASHARAHVPQPHRVLRLLRRATIGAAGDDGDKASDCSRPSTSSVGGEEGDTAAKNLSRPATRDPRTVQHLSLLLQVLRS